MSQPPHGTVNYVSGKRFLLETNVAVNRKCPRSSILKITFLTRNIACEKERTLNGVSIFRNPFVYYHLYAFVFFFFSIKLIQHVRFPSRFSEHSERNGLVRHQKAVDDIFVIMGLPRRYRDRLSFGRRFRSSDWQTVVRSFHWRSRRSGLSHRWQSDGCIQITRWRL